jgi:hypothetical protein
MAIQNIISFASCNHVIIAVVGMFMVCFVDSKNCSLVAETQLSSVAI